MLPMWGGGEIVELWNNPSTVGTQSEQIVTLSESINNFRFYFVMYNIEPVHTGDARSSTGLIPITSPTMLQGLNFDWNDPTTSNFGLFMYRACGPVANNPLQFNIGVGYYTTVGYAPTAYTGSCVIRRIYGVR